MMKGKKSGYQKRGDKRELNSVTPNKEKDIQGENFGAVLEGIDREISFYRKRAGQIYFFGFLVEGLFLVGEQKLVFPKNLSGWSSYANAILFLLIGAIGFYLGREYRTRIHTLRESRISLLEAFGYIDFYSHPKDKGMSEIKTLYRLLMTLSIVGAVINLLPLKL
jgi:hypothetical protein